MSLFKPLRGSRVTLDAQPLHDGYAYFCTDDGSFHIDYTDADGVLQRKQINAKEAESLIGFDPTTYQPKEDEDLTTTDKTVVGAINEINDTVSQLSSIMDLTNTSWTFNDTLPLENVSADFAVNFISFSILSDTTEYSRLVIEEIDAGPDGFINALRYDDRTAYTVDPSFWATEDYKHVTFVGGADIANPNLISLLYTCATLDGSNELILQSKIDFSLTTEDKTVVGAINEVNDKTSLLFSVQDLTNTSWRFGDLLTFDDTSIDFAVNFVTLDDLSNEKKCSRLYIGTSRIYIDTNFYDIQALTYDGYVAYDITNQRWANEGYKHFAIKGGTDVTNADLISFLYKNATLEGLDELVVQSKIDSRLNTKDKSVVDAINELETKSLDKVTSIDTWSNSHAENLTIDNEYGIEWNEGYAFYDDNNTAISSGTIHHNIPILAGDSVTFTVDEESQIVKINVPAIGDIQTALDSIIAQTNSIIGGES